jgi:hypothetical protein
MKKQLQNILLAFMLIASSSAVHAQWKLNGNANATSTSKLGTTNNIDLNLFTNNVKRMTFKSGGNIGIGTATPLSNYGVHILGGIGDAQAQGLYIQRADNPPTNQDCALGIGFSSNLFTGVGIGGGSCGFILTPSVNTPSPDMAFSTNSVAPQMIIKFSGKVGIGTAAPNHHFELSDDDAFKSITSTWMIPSDARLKTNITDFTDGLSVLEKIHPVRFNYNGIAGTQTGVDAIGTLAQDLQQAAPYMVKTWAYTDADGKQTDYLGVEYHALFFILTNSVKELAVQNDELKAENVSLKSDIAEMKSEIAELQQMVTRTLPGDAKVSSSSALPTLSEIAPNPLSQKATVTFTLPADASNAQLLITDASGKMMKTYSLSSGSTEQIINASKFAAGVYQYSLIVNGKIIDSKQMVIAK